LGVAEETEDVEEKVDEVEVKTDRAHDVFVGRQALVDEICVIDDVSAEDEATTNREDKVHGAAERDENSNEASHTKSDKASEQEGSHSFEVILRLEGKQGQTKKDTDCDGQSLKDDDIWIERNRYTECEGLHQSKCGKKHQVPWVGMSLPVEKTKDNQSTEKRKIKGPYV